MNLDYDFLKDQYNQANEHLRETDKKRDVLVGFYITLTVAFYGFYSYLGKDPTLAIYLIVGLTLFGVCLGILFTLYRGWHGIYVIIAIIIQQKMHNKCIVINRNFVKEIDFKFNLFTSAELFTYLILCTIIFLNALESYKLLLNVSPKICAISLLSIAVLQFIFHFLGMWWLDHLKKKEKLTTKYLWILQKTCPELDKQILP